MTVMALRALLRRGQGMLPAPMRGQSWPIGDGQRRFLAKEAAAAPKVATPNAAKNVKAKSATKKEEKRDQRQRFDSLIDACLDAAPPVQALKEKERLRLQEREKLGVAGPHALKKIEQERAREKASKEAKKAAKEAKAKASSAAQGGRAEGVFAGAVLVKEGQIALTVEEGKRLAKQCSRVLFMESRDRAQGEVIRLTLKKNAIAALPQHLREAALVPDLTPFPRNRIPASITPPIQGYVEDRASAAAQAVTVKKTR